MTDYNYYKVGGSLEYQHPTYVVRQADTDLYAGLTNGEFCYVLNSRQMGKSSLRVQMMKKLKQQGFKCASIDMTRIGSHVTPAEWYAGVVSELLRGFGLGKKVNFSSWWRDREMLPPLQRLSELIEDVLLAESSQKLVIFIDEIDSIIKIKFKEDFFAFIRACYNQRVDNPEYNRLTFCLLGVATPSDLIEDRNLSTPFNIGRAIELTGFQLHEATPLAQGLTGKTSDSQALMREVLEWTGGQPFLTQKVCKLILNAEGTIPEGNEAAWVENLVRSRLIENWETQDEPEHLRTVRDRILWSSRKEQLLHLYQQILQTGEVKASDKPEYTELRLSGLVVKQQGKLRVYNCIYESVFNRSWVENALAEAGLLPEVTETSALSKAEIPKSDIQTIEQAALDALQQFESQQIEALISAMQAGQALKALVGDGPLQDYPTLVPLYALQTILNNIREQNWFMANRRGVTGVSFSPNGQRLATAGIDGTIRIWNLSGFEIAERLGHQGTVYCLRFSPDGELIVTSGADSTIQLWDVSKRQIIKWRSYQWGVRSVSFSPNQQYLVTGGGDGTVRLWNLSGQQLAQWEGHQGAVRSLSFSPDGKQIATGGEDRIVRLWDLSGQKLAQCNGHQGSVRHLSFNPDGKQIATAGGKRDSTIRLWDLSGQELAQLRGHQGGINSVSFSPDGRQIATGGEDATVRLWNLTGQELAQLKSHLLGVSSVSFSPNGQYLVSVGWEGIARLWDLSEKHLSQWHSNSLTVRSVSFSPDGQSLATAGADSTVRLWNLQGKQLAQLDGHEGRVRRVSFSTDGQRLATLGDDSTVRLWNLQGQHIVLNGHRGRVNSVSFSPDGLRLATAGDDGTVRLWNLQGKQLDQFSNHLCRINVVSFSPDGQCLATAGVNGTVRLWNLEGELLLEFKSHRSWVYSMSFCPDGQCFATGGGADGTVRLWNLSGYELAQWQSHRGTVYCISFHPNGQQIATAGEDSMAKLWDLSGRQLAQWQSPNNSVYSAVSFSPDGKYLALAGTGGLQIWCIGGLDELLARGCDWLKDYFVTHPETLEKLEVCQNQLRSIETSRSLATADDAEEAISNRNATLKKESTVLSQQDEEHAIAQFPKSPEQPPTIDSAPQTEVRQLAAKDLVTVFIKMLSRRGDIEKVVAAYAEAQKLDPPIKIPAILRNNICWWGSLYGYAADVIEACETAVALEPENGMFRDSRGLARALTGNVIGAIEDFQALVDWTDDEHKRLKRQRWIDALRAGENPFTEEEIETLFNEHNVVDSKPLEDCEVHQDQLNSIKPEAIANFPSSAQTSQSTSKRILWVDDKPANIADEIARLQEKGIEVTQSPSTAQAMQILMSSGLSFDAIITDMGRTEDGEYQPEAGISFIKAIRKAGIKLPILVYTTLNLYARTINEVVAAGGNGATMSAEELCAWLRDYTNLATKGDTGDSLDLDNAIPKGIDNLPSSASVVPDNLRSECGIDYTRLHDLLAARQWFRADRKTTEIMLRIAGREAEGWLREEDIKNFPCTDLLTIDQLWVKYSNGRFGFSVQKRIWQSAGGTNKADPKFYWCYGEVLGWQDRNGSWLDYCDLIFKTTAPVGHLPGGVLSWLWMSYREVKRLSLQVKSTDGLAVEAWWNIISSLALRLEECTKQPPASTTVARRQLVTTVSNKSGEGFLGEFLVRDKLVRIYQGDITNQVTDVIVSSDDIYLTMGGGVSYRIREVGGEEIYREASNLIPLSLSEVAVTTAGQLQAKKVFHAVVIDFYDREGPSEDVIQRVVHACMKKARGYKFRSIAFPLLGTGAGGFPVKAAWEITLRQVIRDLAEKNQNIAEVVLVLYGSKIAEELNIKRVLEKIKNVGWRRLL